MLAPKIQMAQDYRQDEAQQILQLAIARQARNDELSRAQLLEIAEELGISPDEIQVAEGEWQARKVEAEQRQAFNALRRSKWQRQAVNYLIVNAFLVLLNLVTGHTLSWALYILLGWGVGLALGAWRAYQTQGEEHEKAFQFWRRKRQLKQSVGVFLDRLLKA